MIIDDLHTALVALGRARAAAHGSFLAHHTIIDAAHSALARVARSVETQIAGERAEQLPPDHPLRSALEELACLLDDGPEGPLEEHYTAHKEALDGARSRVALLEAEHRIEGERTMKLGEDRFDVAVIGDGDKIQGSKIGAAVIGGGPRHDRQETALGLADTHDAWTLVAAAAARLGRDGLGAMGDAHKLSALCNEIATAERDGLLPRPPSPG